MNSDQMKASGEQETILELEGRRIRLIQAHADTFRNAFAKARPVLRFGEFTVPPDRYDYERADNFLTEDGLAGFSVSRAGWLMSVFSILPERGFLRAAGPVMRTAADKLNCMVGAGGTDRLVASYEAVGFVVCAVTVDDEVLLRRLYGDPYVDRFLREHGSPHHVFMVNRDWRKLSRFSVPEAVGYSGDIPVFQDYYTGKQYTAELAERLKDGA